MKFDLEVKSREETGSRRTAQDRAALISAVNQMSSSPLLQEDSREDWRNGAPVGENCLVSLLFWRMLKYGVCLEEFGLFGSRPLDYVSHIRINERVTVKVTAAAVLNVKQRQERIGQEEI